MSSLREHADEILRANILPPDVFVAIDNITDNLVIHGAESGFAVTHHCLDGWKLDKILHDVQAAALSMIGGDDTDLASVQPLNTLFGKRRLAMPDGGTLTESGAANGMASRDQTGGV